MLREPELHFLAKDLYLWYSLPGFGIDWSRTKSGCFAFSIEAAENQVKTTLVLLKRNDDKDGHRGSDGNASTAQDRAGTDVYDIAIRPLTRSDVRDLHYYCFPEETVESVADYVDRALGFVEKGTAAHLVAESRGHAVANAQLICWRSRAEIGSLVVAEPLRGCGIGSALIAALSEAAVDLGAEQIEIGADKRDERVLGLYQRLGFSPFKEVHLSTDGPEEEHVVYLEKPVPPRG